MAKVDTIEININGEHHKYNVNVGKSGVFKCNLDWKVANLLGINSTQEHTQLSELRKVIMTAVRSFVEATKKKSLWIKIMYKSSGHFFRNSEGKSLDMSQRSNFHADGFSTDGDKVVFDFEILQKTEYTTGTVEWHTMKIITKKSVDHWLERGLDERVSNIVETDAGYYLDEDRIKHGIRDDSSDVIIEYSDQAYDTLLKAREGIRKISEILYNLASSEEEEIIKILNQGKLLTK